ncbi:MAG: YjbQ family protein [Actinomycetota bacterium]
MLTYDMTCEATAPTTLGFVDITEQVQNAVALSQVTDGRVTVLRSEPGCSLILNEQERGLHADVQATIRRLELNNGSGPPPVGSASLVLPVVGGRIHLGTWQRILMLELEQPRTRPLLVQVVGE